MSCSPASIPSGCSLASPPSQPRAPTPRAARAARAAAALDVSLPDASPESDLRRKPNRQAAALSLPDLSLRSALERRAVPALTRYGLAWLIGLLSLEALEDFSLGATLRNAQK